jgi:predicted O-linked N-acetylglucosamine transferase (SPINDLY family)
MYQPVFDGLLAEILGGDPRGFAALILDHRWPGAADLRRRLRRRVGDENFRRIYCMPTLPAETYLRYMTAADVVLESPVRSGETGTLDALSRGIVCVAMEGGLQVRRQTAARYREMGLEELIAADEKAYVELALRLSREPEYRHSLSKKLLEKKALLVNRADTVAALSGFFESVVSGPLDGVPRH